MDRFVVRWTRGARRGGRPLIWPVLAPHRSGSQKPGPASEYQREKAKRPVTRLYGRQQQGAIPRNISRVLASRGIHPPESAPHVHRPRPSPKRKKQERRERIGHPGPPGGQRPAHGASGTMISPAHVFPIRPSLPTDDASIRRCVCGGRSTKLAFKRSPFFICFFYRPPQEPAFIFQPRLTGHRGEETEGQKGRGVVVDVSG